MTILIFVIVLSILILIHEFGHFIVAKKAGVRVEEFALGFPPKLFSKRIGETLYSVNALPIGGFVRLFGEDEPTEADKKRSFFAQPMGVKLAVALAGAGMNLLLGVGIFAVLYSIVGIPTSQKEYVTVGEVIAGKPAEKAGFAEFDRILSVEGEKIDSVEQLQDAVAKYEGKEVEILVDRSPVVPLAHVTVVKNAKPFVTISVTPQKEEGADRATIGVRPGLFPIANSTFYPPVQMFVKSISAGFVDSMLFSKTVLFSLGDMVRNLVVKREIPKDVSGPVGIAILVGEVSKFGFLPLLSIVGVLSLNLAVINLIPFPGLDGARALFVVLQKLVGNRIAPQIEKNIHLVGIVLLLTLVALITVRDVGRFFN